MISNLETTTVSDVAVRSAVRMRMGQDPLPKADHADPVVLCTTDENYVMPLAVTLTSAAENLRWGRSLRVFLVDAGIHAESREKLFASLADQPIELTLIPADVADLRDLSVSHHISHTAYLRLLADRWLPSDLDRVIYLDSDLLVQDSLTELWQIPFEGAAVFAVPDIACPYINARTGCSNFRKSSPYLACLAPVINHSELGLPGAGMYFNSGVMVMNLAHWRREGLGDRLLACLRQHRRHIWCWDQYALNVVLADQWKRLPLRWNVGTHAFEYPTLQHAPIESAEFADGLTHPAIWHFTTEFKPWHYHSRHPLRERFFAVLDQTAWAGWRPARPNFSLHRWWQRRAVQLAKSWTISYRKLAAWRLPEPA